MSSCRRSAVTVSRWRPAYRVGLLDEVEELVAADRLKPAFLFERCRVLRLSDAEMLRDRALARLDPELGIREQPQRAVRL